MRVCQCMCACGHSVCTALCTGTLTRVVSAAVASLNGRFFARRSVRADYYDQGRFDRGDLAA
jgi:hypothetical protein